MLLQKRGENPGYPGNCQGRTRIQPRGGVGKHGFALLEEEETSLSTKGGEGGPRVEKLPKMMITVITERILRWPRSACNDNINPLPQLHGGGGGESKTQKAMKSGGCFPRERSVTGMTSAGHERTDF